MTNPTEIFFATGNGHKVAEMQALADDSRLSLRLRSAKDAGGMPAVVEDTGFGQYLPTGEGLFPFEGHDGAMEALRRAEADPIRAGRAARAIAEEFFDSDKVLTGLLRQCGLV